MREITSDPGRLAIAEAIISMAHRLDLRVVAEMTETEGQIVVLASMDCDLAQGFSKPLPTAQCLDILRAGRVPPPAPMQREPEVQTVLVLDDNPVIAALMDGYLRQEGYHVLIANRAAEAFELLARHRVDVVMPDQCMPHTTGVDFLTTVKRLYPDTTRLIFSAQTDFDAAVDAINQGAVHKFLVKPLQVQTVHKILQDIFRRQRVTAATAISVQ